MAIWRSRTHGMPDLDGGQVGEFRACQSGKRQAGTNLTFLSRTPPAVQPTPTRKAYNIMTRIGGKCGIYRNEGSDAPCNRDRFMAAPALVHRSEEHTSELQSPCN